ncbi:HesB/YadR/YfhF family protein [Platysternon megacephalum]|uniref:HesB/YadR/YfhF family protein n=1 Tax=Platysternon megacephalum TaxID=55544 RepID=A0A4D9DFF1_9SAUR|nr:HesB/YadR/YfhF family protein [Platysternon megacephalum]
MYQVLGDNTRGSMFLTLNQLSSQRTIAEVLHLQLTFQPRAHRLASILVALVPLPNSPLLSPLLSLHVPWRWLPWGPASPSTGGERDSGRWQMPLLRTALLCKWDPVAWDPGPI